MRGSNFGPSKSGSFNFDPAPLHHAWAPCAAQKWLPTGEEEIPSLPGTRHPMSITHYGTKQWKVQVGHPLITARICPRAVKGRRTEQGSSPRSSEYAHTIKAGWIPQNTLNVNIAIKCIIMRKTSMHTWMYMMASRD